MKKSLLIVIAAAAIGVAGWYGYAAYNQGRKPSNNSPAGSGLTKVELTNHGLTTIEPYIYENTAAKELILSNNHIQTLPVELGSMTRLEVLKLDHNQLQGSLIAEIQHIPLRELDVSYNKLTGIPAEIGKLKNLEILDYRYNNVANIPNEIGQLKQLKELRLTGNPLNATHILRLQLQLPNTHVVF